MESLASLVYTRPVGVIGCLCGIMLRFAQITNVKSVRDEKIVEGHWHAQGGSKLKLHTVDESFRCCLLIFVWSPD